VRQRRETVILAALCALLGLRADAAPSTDIEIVPGPAVMSPAERALAPDPAAGTEHAEILMLEFERNEDYAADALLHFHMRAKIHTTEARDLGDVEIPHRTGHDRITRWWGRVIQPDGPVQELTEDQLERQLVSRVGDAAYQSTKAALPGVVPGCVIDYGYTLKLESAYYPYQEIRLQRGYRIHSFRYRWKPTPSLSSAYRVRQGDNLELSVKQDKNSILVTGRDLKPLVLEPMMPPPDALAATAILYYWDDAAGHKDFWKYEARRRAGKERPAEEVLGAVAEIGLDASATLDERLRAVYEWTLRTIENTSLARASGIEMQTFAPDTNEAAVLARRTGGAQEIDLLFLQLARAVGAEANVVLATDRRLRLWDPGLLSMDQFTELFVAVRDPATPGADYVFLDPGSGFAYGEVPWWVTGTEALLASRSGASAVFIPPPPASQNVRETKVSVRFGEEGKPANATWSVRGTGQAWWHEHGRLLQSPPDARRRRLSELCGDGGGVAVTRAEAPGLGDPLVETRLECEAELTSVVLDRPYDWYRYDSRGRWSRALPDLPAGERVHPVVFDYPYVELTSIEVEPPPEMVPGAAPDPVQIDSPYGRYQRQVTVAGGKIVDVRKLAIVALAVPPAEYDDLREFRERVTLAETTPVEFVRGAAP
jgi:hypothetical protein